MSSGEASLDPVLEEALAWRAEAADPDMPAHRARALEAWLRLPAHALVYRQAEGLWRDLGWSQVLNEEALKVELLRRPGRGASVMALSRRRWLAAGAGLVAAGVAGLVLTPRLASLWSAGIGSEPESLRLATAVGEIRQVTLADGSRLSLGGESEAVVRLADDRRVVELLSGDAWFEVARDPSRPFSVTTDGLTATVLGTVFEVRRNRRGVQVGVAEGRVRVEAGPGVEPVVLTGGQGVRRLADGVLRPFDAAGVGRWRQQRFAYRNVLLSEMVEDLNRYHPPGVRLARPDLGDLRVSAAFRLDQLETALDGLAVSHDLTVTRHADGGFVLS